MKAFLITSLLAVSATSHAVCVKTMEKTAVQSLAKAKNANPKEIFVVRSELGAWTEAVANNTGVGEVTLELNDKVIHLQASLKQVGSSDECTVTQLKKVSSKSIDPLALQAEKYRLAIRNAVHVSEGDEEWTPFYLHKNVKNFSTQEIMKALNVYKNVGVWSAKQSMDFLEDYANENDENLANPDDVPKYKALIDVLKKDFKEFRIIKVGEEDSGGLDLYLLGITPDGELVGLHTISVET